MGGTACAKAAFTHEFSSGIASKKKNYLINSWRGDDVQPERSTCAQHGLRHTVQFVIADYFLADVESLSVNPHPECKTVSNHPPCPPLQFSVSSTEETRRSCFKKGSEPLLIYSAPKLN